MNNSLCAAAAMILSLASHSSMAEASLANGTVVRIQSNSIEGGWHSGRMHLDARKCWMVKLDKATKDDYTMLALLVVDQLQVSANGGWAAVSVKPLLDATPADCREEGAD